MREGRRSCVFFFGPPPGRRESRRPLKTTQPRFFASSRAHNPTRSFARKSKRIFTTQPTLLCLDLFFPRTRPPKPKPKKTTLPAGGARERAGARAIEREGELESARAVPPLGRGAPRGGAIPPVAVLCLSLSNARRPSADACHPSKL